MNRNETHEDVVTTVPAITGVPVVGRGDGHCKRAGCGKPLPPGGRGRSREFCSDECLIFHRATLSRSIFHQPDADSPIC